MDADRLLTAFIGAALGAAGWLVVGLYIQRRQYDRQARNAARAVYFELSVNQTNVDVAARHGSFQPLGRSTYERLLPELATWLRADELHTVARAYMCHAGYEQVGSDRAIPAPVRTAVLERILADQNAALGVLRTRAFSPAEARSLSGAATATEQSVREPEALTPRAGGSRSG